MSIQQERQPNPDTRRADGTLTEGELPKAATRNACKMCSPLGAAMVFKGIRGCLPFLHGSQGCATYIRRYMISHFREPVDIASSSFSEDDAIFGGARNFETGVDNVIEQYEPELVGVATTCLSETIGDNMLGMIKTYRDKHDGNGPPMVNVSTPAYTGTHSDGFYATIKAVVQRFVRPVNITLKHQVNIFPAMMSCADLRYLRESCRAYDLEPVILPDYNETLEGASWDCYHRISPGGTGLEEIEEMSASKATVEIGHMQALAKESAGAWLENEHGVQRHSLGWPIGIRLSDQYFTSLSEISGRLMPDDIAKERGRLVDSYVDAHKYIAGKRAIVLGEPDFVVGLAAFLSEVGIRPVVCATGSKVKDWESILASEIEGGIADVEAISGVDHAKISTVARKAEADLIVGSSKAYPLTRELKIPQVRVGFPIHDRVGAQRILSVGYRGTQALFDEICNAIMEGRQDESSTGYSYL